MDHSRAPSSWTVSRGWANLLEALRRSGNGLTLDDDERADWLQLNLRLALAAVPGTVACSITRQAPQGHFATPVYAGPIALDLDAAQYDADDGPCLSAARHWRRERVDDMSTDGRWPDLSEAATARGVRASLSVPLDITSPAALNFYSLSARCYLRPEPARLAGFVARTASALVGSGNGTGDPLRSGFDDEQIRWARARHEAVRDAMDTLMQRDGVDEASAYRSLAVQSARSHQPMDELAQHILGDGPRA